MAKVKNCAKLANIADMYLLGVLNKHLHLEYNLVQGAVVHHAGGHTEGIVATLV